TNPSVTVIQPASRNPEPASHNPHPESSSNPDLELEIKETPEIEEKTIAKAAIGSLATRYDATLDLKDYKYPG
ncbi:hypothetical protein, partial [Acinetobacter baumannii]|uniref:hypothetical protein n=1 Tax=Acinetobacter baumannii TaxID=470 RepID=UPI001C09AC17